MASNAPKAGTIRKLLACELQVLTFNSEKNAFELKVEGRQFDVRLIWLQGYLNQDAAAIPGGEDADDDLWFFSDRTASGIPVVIPPDLRQTLIGPIDENCYYSVVVGVETVDGSTVAHGEKIGRNAKLRAKRLININHEMFDEEARVKHNEMVEEIWCYEVVQYHRAMCQSDIAVIDLE